MAAYQRFMSISAYRIAGGSEERANSHFSASSSSTGAGAAAKSRGRPEDDLPKPLARKIKGTFLDSLYAFLDGLVHVAFSDPATIFTTPSHSGRKGPPVEAAEAGGRPSEVDVQNVVSADQPAPRRGVRYFAHTYTDRHCRTSESSSRCRT